MGEARCVTISHNCGSDSSPVGRGGDGLLGLGDLLVDAAQAPAGPVVLVLVVDDLVVALVGGAGRVSPREALR